MNLGGKTALVSGASRGIGRAVALAFAKAGANVALVYAGSEQAAEQVKSEAIKLGVNAKTYKCDVADFAATKQLTAQVIEDFGGVDILVNNAGIVKDTLMLAMTEEDFDSVINVNLKGAFNLTKHLYQHFMRKRYGRIVNITSVVGLNGNAGQANYAASKAGMIGLTKSTAKELAARGVTCNAVAPGMIESDMTKELSEKVQGEILARIPQKRMGNADEVAQLVLFLASDAAAYITGEVVRVDGGMSM